MDRKYLVIIGIAVGVVTGVLITLTGNNPTEAQIKLSPAQEGTIDSGLIPAGQTITRTFTANKEGTLFIEFDIKMAGAANVSYTMNSPTGKKLLAAPTVSSSTILKIDDQSYTLIPMIGSPQYEDLSGNLVFVNYARANDVPRELDGSLALAERGGAAGESGVSFLQKQINVVNRGAAALIVFNNDPGLFYGDLNSMLSNVQPTIPTFSISREDGLQLKKLIDEKRVVATITDTGNQSDKFTLPYANFDIIIDEKGVYEIQFHNDGPGTAMINVKYIFRES